jgi:hypothetical protein
MFEEEFGDGEQSYIKMKDIAQNTQGDKYAVAFFDDGKFYVRVFGKENRSKEQI